MYQVWFSVLVEPVLTDADWELASRLTDNYFVKIGNIVDGRLLARVLTTDWEPIQTALNAKNKQVIVCGAKYKDGSSVENFVRNETEFDKYVQPVSINGVEITPPDNTSAGWSAFYE